MSYTRPKMEDESHVYVLIGYNGRIISVHRTRKGANKAKLDRANREMKLYKLVLRTSIVKIDVLP